MRWIVLGKSGMFGSQMVSYLERNHEQVMGLNSSELDLTSEKTRIEEALAGFDVVVNATAYTDVNLAEQEPKRAFEINRDVPKKLSRITAANKQKLVHVSTDYVFDGKKGSPYQPNDQPNPLNVYGESKLAGEEQVKEHNSKALILRTSWLYGPHGKCFPRNIIKSIREGKGLTVVNDQVGTPTSTEFLSSFCYRAIDQNFEGGVYHAVPIGATSWFGFAQRISAGHEIDLKPQKTMEQDGIATRPRWSQLNPHSSVKETWEECWDNLKFRFWEGEED